MIFVPNTTSLSALVISIEEFTTMATPIININQFFTRFSNLSKSKGEEILVGEINGMNAPSDVLIFTPDGKCTWNSQCGKAEVLIKKRDECNTLARASSINEIREALRLGYDIDEADPELCNRTPFMTHCWRSNYDLALELVRNGCDVTCRDNRKAHTGFDYACFSKNIKFVEDLLQFPQIRELLNDSKGHDSPLINAVRHEKYDTVDLLLRYGADINYQNSLEQTALMIAVLKRDASMIRKLLSHGADTSIRSENMTAMDFAREYPQILSLFN